MKIYTKTGDTGQTSLFGGGRVSKATVRIEAYGTVDELNSHLGFIRALKVTDTADNWLEIIQNDLFTLGADLATPIDTKVKIKRISNSESDPLEKWIDKMEESLAPLKFFILPGGSPAAAAIQIARTVCRRAERCVITAAESEQISNDCIIYLNRLSDFLFVLSRYENSKAGISEIKWQAR
jgi:cob(I)alamin adenosyltransferase